MYKILIIITFISTQILYASYGNLNMHDWNRYGVYDKDEAINWKKAGIYPSKIILIFKSKNISPLYIYEWTNLGITPDRIVSWLDAGIKIPQEAKKWEIKGLTPQLLKEIKKLNISEKEKNEWIAAGVLSARHIKFFTKNNISKEDGSSWYSIDGSNLNILKIFIIEYNITYQQYEKWQQLNVGYNIIISFLKIGITDPEIAAEWFNCFFKIHSSESSNAPIMGSIKGANFNVGSKFKNIKFLVDHGIEPNACRDWIYHGFSQGEVLLWIKNGFTNPLEVKQWKKLKVSPVNAGIFHKYHLSPEDSISWKIAFSDLKKTQLSVIVSRPQLKYPDSAESYPDLVLNSRVVSWIKAGFKDPKTSKYWAELGIEPEKALKYNKLKFSPIEIYNKCKNKQNYKHCINSSIANRGSNTAIEKNWKIKGITVDENNNIYVLDSSDHIIIKFDSKGEVLIQWKVDGQFILKNTQKIISNLIFPTGIALDSKKNIYITDEGDHSVKIFNSEGKFIAKWSNQDYLSKKKKSFYLKPNEAPFNHPKNIKIDINNNIFVVNRNSVVKLDSHGELLKKWSNEPTGNKKKFLSFYNVAVDIEENIYIVDGRSCCIHRINGKNNYSNRLGLCGNENGEFVSPIDVSIDLDGNIYVLDSGSKNIPNNTNGKIIRMSHQFVQKFDSKGHFLEKWYIHNEKKTDMASGLIIDKLGYIYITYGSDYVRNYIKKFNSKGKFTKEIKLIEKKLNFGTKNKHSTRERYKNITKPSQNKIQQANQSKTVLASTSKAYKMNTKKTILTVAGILKIAEDDYGPSGEKHILFKNKIIYKVENVFIYFEKIYNLKNSTIIIVNEDCGGSSATPSYFFIEIYKNGKINFSKKFWSMDATFKPSVLNNTIRVDLGYNNKLREYVTFSNGKLREERKKSIAKGLEAKSCKWLYSEIYKEYIHNAHSCTKQIGYALATYRYRGYYMLIQNPNFNESFFREMLTEDCKSGIPLTYHDFSRAICQGNSNYKNKTHTSSQSLTCSKYHVIIVKQLNIRNKPKKHSKVIGKINRGESVCIYEFSGKWGRSDKGWISGKYLERNSLSKNISTSNQKSKIYSYMIASIPLPTRIDKVYAKLGKAYTVELPDADDPSPIGQIHKWQYAGGILSVVGDSYSSYKADTKAKVRFVFLKGAMFSKVSTLYGTVINKDNIKTVKRKLLKYIKSIGAKNYILESSKQQVIYIGEKYNYLIRFRDPNTKLYNLFYFENSLLRKVIQGTIDISMAG